MTEVKRSVHDRVQQNSGQEDGAAPKRAYRLRQRAEEMAQTRQRIAQAAFELHRDIGPASTTISAIAERAGVQRHTVYRHFPTMASLYEACTAHGMATTGVPDPETWTSVSDPPARLWLGLREMYDYYARNERLLTNVLKDELVPGGAPPSTAEPDAFTAYMTRVHQVLTEPWPEDSQGRTIVGLALDFWTWRSLVRGQGKTVDEAVDLWVAMTGSRRAE